MEDGVSEIVEVPMVKKYSYMNEDYSTLFYEEEEDTYDYVNEEAAFFAQCAAERESACATARQGRDSGLGMQTDVGEDENIGPKTAGCRKGEDSAPDSGVNSSREARWNGRPNRAVRNQSRSDRYLIVGEVDKKRKDLAILGYLQHNSTSSRFELSEKRLARELVNMIHFPVALFPIRPADKPLYSVEDGMLVVNEKYRFPGDGILARHQDFYIRSMGELMLPTCCLIEDLVHFTDQQRVVPEPPVFVQVWIRFYDNYMLKYEEELNQLANSVSVPMSVFFLTSDLRECISLLHAIVRPIKAARSWKWTEVEFAWSNLLNVIGAGKMLTEAQTRLAASLQSWFIPVLLNTMDIIYQRARVPDSMQEHFILYNDVRSPGRLLMRLQQENVNYPLWTDELVRTILRGVRYRHSLGVPSSTSPVFTSLFYEKLKSERDIQPDRLCTVFDVHCAFRSAADQLTLELDEQLRDSLLSVGLYPVMKDIQNITIGNFSQYFAIGLLGINSQRELNRRPLDTFHQVSTICRVSDRALWSLNEEGKITCMTERPLSMLISSPLLEAVNDYVAFYQQLFRVDRILISVSTETFRPSAVEKFALFGSGLRRYQLVIRSLLAVIRTIRAQFHEKAASVFRVLDEKAKSSSNCSQLEDAFFEAVIELSSIVHRKRDRRVKDVLEIMDIFVALVDEIRLVSLCGVSDEKVSEWMTRVKRSLDYLSSLGRHFPKDSMFHGIHLALKYRSPNY